MIIAMIQCPQLGDKFKDYIFGEYNNINEIENPTVKEIAKKVIIDKMPIKSGIWYVYLEGNDDD
jgi:hypothetical protein